MFRTIVLLVCILTLTGCASLNSLPSSVHEANMDNTVGGKVGWSRYQASDFFSGVDKDTTLRAARHSLNAVGFIVKKDDPQGGYVMGEHGLTMYDWNVVCGVYIMESNDGCKAKVIAQGSRDIGFAGDATASDWPLDVLRAMRQYFAANVYTSESKPSTELVSYGTGFAVSSIGYIVTAFHVIEDKKSTQIKFPGGHWQDAEVISHSSLCDVAILKVNSPTQSFLKVAPEPTVEIGDKVFTVGYPVTDLLGEDPKYTDGVVSSLTGIKGDATLMQVSVPVQPGSSGGPLVSEDGSVIGVVLSTVAVESFYKVTGALPQNVNWAVRSNIVYPLVKKYANGKIPEDITRNNIVARVRKATCLVSGKSQ
jgi:S1-C subfamily serine protease